MSPIDNSCRKSPLSIKSGPASIMLLRPSSGCVKRSRWRQRPGMAGYQRQVSLNARSAMNKEKPMTLRAVIAGVTGLIGSNLAEHLASKGWKGLRRRLPQGKKGHQGRRRLAGEHLDEGPDENARLGQGQTSGEPVDSKETREEQPSRCKDRPRDWRSVPLPEMRMRARGSTIVSLNSRLKRIEP